MTVERRTIPNPTPEQKAFIEDGRREWEELRRKAEAGLLAPVDERFRAKMQSQTDLEAALDRPGSAAAACLRAPGTDREAAEPDFG